MKSPAHILPALVASVAIGIATLQGCAFDFEACQSNDDCPEGTTCTRPPGTDVPVCLDTQSSEEMPGQTNGTTGPDDRPGETDDPDDPTPAPECPVFQECGADEPNDERSEATWLSRETLGCAGFGLEQWRETRSDEACVGDADYYRLEYVACEESSFKLTVTLEPEGDCPGGILELVDGPFSCRDDNVRCTERDERSEITIIVAPREFPQPVETVVFSVRPADPELGVEYTLYASTGR